MNPSGLPILYSFRRCPYAIRARMALVAANTQVQLRELLLRDKPPCMLEYSPKGTVPVLVLPDRRVIDESLQIMHWALQQNDPQQWLGGADTEQQQQLIRHNDGEFKYWLDRYKYHDRHPQHSRSHYQAQVRLTLDALDQQLQSTGFLYDQQPRLADFALFPFIRQCAFVDKPWFDSTGLTALQHWLQQMLDSAVFKRSMIKLELFNAGHSYVFPA